jgi:SAM-dependent methyltransferase
MDENARERIRNIKSRVVSMLEERHRLENGSTGVVSPSKYWLDFCSFFDYMLWLPEESFSKLRLHTYHLTADNYQIYYFGVNERPFRDFWRELIEGIPSEYVLYEPEGGIGYSFDNGRVVSHDILRFQHIVNTFYRYGIISSMADGGRKLVLEIGAGYGGLAHHLSNVLGNVTYIVVDLPETLLFSASYLSLNNPDKRIYVYGDRNLSEFLWSPDLSSYDFVLIPNYRLDELRPLRFDLAINIASLQEMSLDQVSTYLGFIAENCRGVFYSWNQDSHPKNAELGNLSEIIRSMFEITEVSVGKLPTSLELPSTKRKNDTIRRRLRRLLKSIAISLNLWERPVEAFPYPPFREWICRPFRNKG